MRELPPDTYTRRKNKLKECFQTAPPARVAAKTSLFPESVYLELAKGIEPPTL
jgi:hypothetical protein